MKTAIRLFFVLLFLAAALLIAQNQAGWAPSPIKDTSSLPAKIDYAGLSARLAQAGNRILLLDVRSAEEYAEGHIPGSILQPYDSLERMFKEGEKGRPIVVYCRSGRRSSIAMATLLRMGYTNVADFGAIDNWKGRLER